MSTLPDFRKEVTGQCYGGAYWSPAEYTVRMRRLPPDRFLLTVEDPSGMEINGVPLTEDEVDGILKVAETNHSLAVYEDDWEIPVNIERTVYWDLGDEINSIRLDESNLDEIAAWLRFATGLETYDGNPEEWEF